MQAQKFTSKGFLIWAICAIFFLYEFFLRTLLGSFQMQLMYDLKMTAFQFSFVSTTIFLAFYGLMQIPVGLIIDNYGLKKSLILGVFICIIASLSFAFTKTFTGAVLSRMLMGIGASFGFICLLISIKQWMPGKYTAIFIGVSQFISTMGPMIATGPLEAHIESIDWRDFFRLLAYIGVGIMLLVIILVEDKQQKSGRHIILNRPQNIKKSLVSLFARAQPWYIAFFSAFSYFAVEYFTENEGRHFLALKDIPKKQIAFIMTISWVGYGIGCPALGFFSDSIQKRKPGLILSAICALTGIIMILYLRSFPALATGFFLVGFGAAGQTIGFATIAEQFKTQFVAVGFGLNNAVLNIVTSLGASVLGALVDIFGAGQISLQTYQSIFLVIVIMTIIAFILGSFFIKETFAKSAVDLTILER